MVPLAMALEVTVCHLTIWAPSDITYRRAAGQVQDNAPGSPTPPRRVGPLRCRELTAAKAAI